MIVVKGKNEFSRVAPSQTSRSLSTCLLRVTRNEGSQSSKSGQDNRRSDRFCMSILDDETRITASSLSHWTRSITTKCPLALSWSIARDCFRGTISDVSALLRIAAWKNEFASHSVSIKVCQTTCYESRSHA